MDIAGLDPSDVRVCLQAMREKGGTPISLNHIASTTHADLAEPRVRRRVAFSNTTHTSISSIHRASSCQQPCCCLMISKDPSPSPPNTAAPPRALHNRSEQWIFGHSLRHTTPRGLQPCTSFAGPALKSSESWSWRAPVARRARSMKPDNPLRTEPCGVAQWELDRQRSARVNRWELAAGCVSQLALRLRRVGCRLAACLVRMTRYGSRLLAARGQGRERDRVTRHLAVTQCRLALPAIRRSVIRRADWAGCGARWLRVSESEASEGGMTL
jgi:hypothetical protein